MEDIVVKLTVDVEESVRQVADFVKKSKDAIETQIPRSVEKAKTAITELASKMKSVSDILDADKKRIDELTRKRDEASGAAKKQIEAELEGMKRIAVGREVELLKLKEKGFRLGEIVQLSTAGSEQEEAAIRKATQARIAELGVTKDQVKAQMGVAGALKDSDSALGSYITKFATIGSALMAMNAISSAIQAQKQAYEDAMAALGRYQEMAKGQQDKNRSFYNEWGIAGGAEQEKAKRLLGTIGSNTGIGQDAAVSAGAALAPFMKAKGIAYDSAQGQGIISNFGAAIHMGINPEAGAQVIGDMMSSDTTGQQVNQIMASVLNGSAGGSASRANSILETWKANKHKFEAVGMSFADIAGIGGSIGKKYSPETAQEVLGGIAESADRLLGITPQDMMNDVMAFSDFGGPMQTDMVKQISEAQGSWSGKLGILQSRRKNGIPQLDQWYTANIDAAAKGGRVDIAGFMSILKTLPQTEQAKVLRAFAGPRKVATAGAAMREALSATGGMPFAGSIPFPTNPADVGAAAASGIIQQISQENTPDPALTEMEAAIKAQPLERTKMGPWQYGAGRNVNRVGTLSLNTPDDEQAKTAMFLSNRLIELASKREGIPNGSPLAKEIDAAMGDIVGQLKNRTPGGNREYAKFLALAQGSYHTPAAGLDAGIGYTRQQVLTEIGQQGLSEWKYQNIPWSANSNAIESPEELRKVARKAYDALHSTAPVAPPATQPTTRPTTQPVSVSYNRIVNYGYGVDSIGGASEVTNNYG